MGKAAKFKKLRKLASQGAAMYANAVYQYVQKNTK